MATDDSFWRKHGLKLAVSLVIALAFVWTFRRGGLPLIPPASAIAKVQPSTYVGYVSLMIVFHFVRAARWRHLLTPIADVPLRRIVAVSWIGFVAILSCPCGPGSSCAPT